MTAALRAYLVRALAFVACAVAAHLIVGALPDDGGADIGAGLLVFALAALAATLWGFADGKRLPIGVLAAVWLAVGATLGAVEPFLISVSFDAADDFDWSVVRSDLVTFLPFTIFLVAGPAIVAGVVAYAARNSAPTHD